MKRLFCLIITLSSLTAQGQDTNFKQKILIGLNFSPDYSYRTLNNNNGSSSIDFVINSRNDIEVPKFGYTTGLNACFNFSQLLGFETGIQFSNKGYKTKSKDLAWIPPSPSLPTKVIRTYSYQYLGMPLKAKFAFGKRQVRLIASVGFMTNILLDMKQTSNYEFPDGQKETESVSLKSDFNKVNISPTISVGIDYKLNNKIHLFAEPTFRYGIIKTIDAPVTEKLWNAGLNLGFYYALK